MNKKKIKPLPKKGPQSTKLKYVIEKERLFLGR